MCISLVGKRHSKIRPSVRPSVLQWVGCWVGNWSNYVCYDKVMRTRFRLFWPFLFLNYFFFLRPFHFFLDNFHFFLVLFRFFLAIAIAVFVSKKKFHLLLSFRRLRKSDKQGRIQAYTRHKSLILSSLCHFPSCHFTQQPLRTNNTVAITRKIVDPPMFASIFELVKFDLDHCRMNLVSNLVTSL